MSNHEYDYLIKIIICGDSSVGRSLMMTRYVDQKNKLNDQTMFEFAIKYVDRNKKLYKLQMWDFNGKAPPRVAGLGFASQPTQGFYRGAHGCLLIYDVTNIKSFDNIKSSYENIKKMCGEEIIIVLVGNKSDLKDQRKVSFEQGKELAAQLNVNFVETSVLQNINIDQCFLHIIDRYSQFEFLQRKQIAPLPTYIEQNNDIGKNNNDNRHRYQFCGCSCIIL